MPTHAVKRQNRRQDLIHRACQETGAIVPAPVNACKMIRGAWSIAPVKKIIFLFFK
jgi:hypothetical protein